MAVVLDLDSGAEFTNSRSVTASFDGVGSNAAEMRFAFNGLDEAKFSSWEPFSPTKTLRLPNWQGTNYVNAQVRDDAGNVAFAWDSIVLDTAAPTANVEINGSADFADSRTVDLTIAATDVTSGPAEMRFAVNSLAESKYSDWESFSPTTTLTLPNWQGTNYVNVQVRDTAGNVAFAWDSIVLDTAAPAADIEINSGAASTGSRTVELAIAATDAISGPAEMRFAVNSLAESKYSDWESFSSSKTLTLPNWQGRNYVNIQVRDGAGNVAFAWDSIVLDTRPPTIVNPAQATDSPVSGTSTELSVLGADASGEANLTYTWTVAAMPNGAASPVFSVNGNNAAKNTEVTFSQAGTYVFTATITDSFGFSTPNNATVLVDQTLTRIQVTPESVSLTSGASQQFSAVGLDQFAMALVTQPDFVWTTAGGGTIHPGSGLFTAPPTPANSTVTVTSGAVSGVSSLTVTLGLNDRALDTLTTAKFTNDGEIDRTEVMEILRSTGSDDGVVDANEFSDLQTILDVASSLNIPDYVQVLSSDVVNGNPANTNYQGDPLGNLTAGSSATRLNKLVDKWFLGADHPVSSYAYQRFAGTLFDNGPEYGDMHQGRLGDCYFIAALGAIAKSSTNAIDNMFVDNGDNTWTVRFYAGSIADYVTVDRFLPSESDGKPAYQGVGGGVYTNNANELWLALAEKAYAQWNETGKADRDIAENSYASIDGGWMDYASDHVLGDNRSDIYWGLPDSDKQKLIAGISANKAVTYGTKSNANNGLAGGHAYVVSGYDSNADKFQLHNPWGHTHPKTLTYAELQASGLVLVIADTAGSVPVAAAARHPLIGQAVGFTASPSTWPMMPVPALSSIGHVLPDSVTIGVRSANLDPPSCIDAEATDTWFHRVGSDQRSIAIARVVHVDEALSDPLDAAVDEIFGQGWYGGAV